MDADTKKLLIQVGIPALTLIIMGCVSIFFNFLLEIRKLRHKKDEIRYQRFNEKYFAVIEKLWDIVVILEGSMLPITGTFHGLQKVGPPPAGLSPDDPELQELVGNYRIAQKTLENAMSDLADFTMRGSLYFDDEMYTHIPNLVEELTPKVLKIKDHLDSLSPIQFITAFREFEQSDTEFGEARSAVLELCRCLRARVSNNGKFWG